MKRQGDKEKRRKMETWNKVEIGKNYFVE